MAIEKVTRWQTSDGALHESPALAEVHEREYRRAIALQKFAEEHGYSGMGRLDLAGLLTKHADELAQIFKDYAP